MYDWDKGLDFSKTRKLLVNSIKKCKKTSERGYLSILLIQLCNGCRVGEAIQAAILWAKSGEREVEVAVEKRKDGYRRLIIIPRELGREERRAILAVTEGRDLRKIKNSVKQFCRRRLGFNTHALRYSFITHLAEKGYSASLIAKITGHKKLDYILHYTERVKAEDILRELNS